MPFAMVAIHIACIFDFMGQILVKRRQQLTCSTLRFKLRQMQQPSAQPHEIRQMKGADTT